MKDEICKFAGISRYCQILVGVKCRGTDELCKFRRTEKQFQQERDRAILMNRAKGNCHKCKYMGTPCRLVSEEGSEESDKLENIIKYAYDTFAGESSENVNIVKKMPAIEAEPVKHGEWLDSKHTDAVFCSKCDGCFPYETPYCPKCGAKMDGGEENA